MIGEENGRVILNVILIVLLITLITRCISFNSTLNMHVREAAELKDVVAELLELCKRKTAEIEEMNNLIKGKLESIEKIYDYLEIELPACPESDERQNYGTIDPNPVEVAISRGLRSLRRDVVKLEEYDKKLMLKLIFCEANTESVECQMAVAQVVLNRLSDESFPNSIYNIIYARNQFTPAGTDWFENAKWTEENETALNRVLEGEKILDDNVVYFWATSIDVKTPGTWYYRMHREKYACTIDNTNFYYK